MPFTFSHPAIVLPLNYLPKKWISLTGLIIGSLTPDFEYFIRMKVQSDHSHTLFGLLWFDLPLGILLAFIFHNIVKSNLFENLPKSLKSRLLNFKNFNWNNHFKIHWLVISISIIVGAFSHILWDSFTHQHGYFVEKITALSNNANILGLKVPIFKILQHSSTIIGGFVILHTLLKLPVIDNKHKKIDYKYWSILTIITLTIILIRLFSGLNYKLYGHLIATGISAGIIGLILTPILTRKTGGNTVYKT